MTEQMSAGMIIKVVNINWGYIKSKFSAAEWDGFVADCRKALAKHESAQDLKKLEAEIETSLRKSDEGKLILQLFKNTLDAVGTRLAGNAPKDSHPTDAVQNSVDELADKVEKEKSAEVKGGDSQARPAKNK